MATPSQVRSGLAIVTGAAVSDVRAVAASAESPGDIRAALFAAVPLVVDGYIDGSAALALDWYEELRDEARVRRPFTPTPLTVVLEEDIASSVAWATEALYGLEQDLARVTDEMLARATADSLDLLDGIVQKDVASGFWDTITSNSRRDPEAVGWRRYARPEACKFCLMCASRGAVYTEATADFAAHTSCLCTCGPAFDPDAPRASAMQYVASSKHRTPEQQAALRRYLNENFPDAPG